MLESSVLENPGSNLTMEETGEQENEACSHPSITLDHYQQYPICLTLVEYQQSKCFGAKQSESKIESRKSILEQEDADFNTALEPMTSVLDYFKDSLDLQEDKTGK